MTAARLAPFTDPGQAATWLALRQIRRGAAVVLAVAAVMPAMVAATYDKVTRDPAALAGLDALAGNAAIRTIFGEPIALNEAGGFTVWRLGTVLAAILGVWTITATTRITRGEEDPGRWDILLAGRLPLRTVLTRHLAVVATAPVAAGAAITAVLLALGGPDHVGALLHGGGMALLGLFAGAVAAVTTQVFPSRAPATGAAVGVLGMGLLIRMAGDGVEALSWLRWLSPFGLLEISAPYGANRLLPLIVLAAATAACYGAALLAAGRRDVGGGVLATASARRARLWLLTSTETFAVRRLLGPLAAWAAGITAYFLIIGLTATSLTGFLTDNTAFTDRAAQAGFAGLNTVNGFAAALFGLLAMPVGAFTAVRLTAFMTAESSRRLTLLAAQPVSRLRLLTSETAVTFGGALVLLFVAAVSMWAGVTTAGGGLTLTAALAGAFNIAPIVLLCLGAALLAAGCTPAAVIHIGSLPATGGFLLKVVADSTGAPDWVSALSPFAHLHAVPLAGVDWPSTGAMTALATLLAVAGAVGYQRRDLRG